MQEQIKIDIPEGKVPIMEQTENGIVITWKEKRLTYDVVLKELQKSNSVISNFTNNSLSSAFHKKGHILRKLTNIRNYFGKRTTNIGYVIAMEFGEIIVIEIKTPLHFSGDVIFAKHEHAEQAIKILGDELKYLFEPW
jgi:hypothetical protein